MLHADGAVPMPGTEAKVPKGTAALPGAAFHCGIDSGAPGGALVGGGGCNDIPGIPPLPPAPPKSEEGALPPLLSIAPGNCGAPGIVSGCMPNGGMPGTGGLGMPPGVLPKLWVPNGCGTKAGGDPVGTGPGGEKRPGAAFAGTPLSGKVVLASACPPDPSGPALASAEAGPE